MAKSDNEYMVIDHKNFTKAVKGKDLILTIPNFESFSKYQQGEIIKGNDKGVYALLNKNRIFYIGKSIQTNVRMKAHGKKYKFDSFLFHPEKDEFTMGLIEAVLVWEHKPIMNQLQVLFK